MNNVATDIYTHEPLSTNAAMLAAALRGIEASIADVTGNGRPTEPINWDTVWGMLHCAILSAEHIASQCSDSRDSRAKVNGEDSKKKAMNAMFEDSRESRAEYLLTAARHFAECLSCATPQGLTMSFTDECALSIAQLIEESERLRAEAMQQEAS